MATIRALVNCTRTLRAQTGSGTGVTQSWLKLGNYAATGDVEQEACWIDLKNKELAVSNTVQGAEKTNEGVDWDKWEKLIAHKDILQHMKRTYDANMAMIERTANMEGDMSHLDTDWELYENARQNCNQATRTVKKIIADGSKALWVSQNNPPAWKVDTNEWLESDQYWQAFVEKHAMYSQSGDAPDPEAPAIVEANKATWNTNMAKFNERTDTPMLYDYMHHLPAWEFYDINRKQFYEHMTYFLLRTGDDFRHFPDMPSWKWLTHIEDLRFKQFAVAHRRREKRQIERVARFEPDDFGTGEEQTGEETEMAILNHEKHATELTLAKLMGNFAFLCDPLVPVQTRFQLHYILSKDGYAEHGQTKVLTLGDDINALFVLPKNAAIGAPLPTPLECFHNMMEHYRISGMRINPTYATRTEHQTELIHQRGPNWLKLPHETVMEAYLRRMRKDDPLRNAFTEYAAELRERIAGAKEVPKEQWESMITEIEKASKEDDMAIKQMENAKHGKMAQKLIESDLQKLMDEGHILVLDPTNNNIVNNATEVEAALKM
ncbi:hypothetical protein BBOV_III003520 [Babesia bovis T2Bo]|uniref:Uncharacterized protein n=1 Tax=Babesia bovis TaxID=5865 RepID=A7AMY2_BABBO|nr:hypothetical protein BBOV_III003520 [Babesia bovis T2Bo]EDO07916.1 hypothetical protein BBOV_III003520 [Babesia bovis T2Bo]|eukprot:XP_001611484.1 hypothetical protein [Babesia bovis T2Bo]